MGYDSRVVFGQHGPLRNRTRLGAVLRERKNAPGGTAAWCARGEDSPASNAPLSSKVLSCVGRIDPLLLSTC
jgi:hypothetical protein